MKVDAFIMWVSEINVDIYLFIFEKFIVTKLFLLLYSYVKYNFPFFCVIIVKHP